MGRNQTNASSSFEALESRTMMSAAPVLHVDAARRKHPAVVASLNIKSIAKTIDPVTTDPSITYKSFADEPLFAAAGPTMADVNQGYLGDCYLLSTLSSVAKTDPKLIEKDIVAGGDGTYTVTFGSGKGTKVNVNADLPVWSDGQVAYASLGVQNSLWVALMEKAYVIYASPRTDNYNSIQGGWMSSAFSALGLKSQTVVNTKGAANLLKMIQADLKAGDFVTLGTQSQVSSDSPLFAGHAYEVDSVTDDSGGNPISVTFRNPWGDTVANDGMITVTPAQAYAAFAGVVVSHA